MKRKKALKLKRLDGFTLSELLVVMIILGILVLLTLPNLLPLITKAKSTEAKLQLRHVHLLQRAYYMEHSEYAESLDLLDFEMPETLDEDGRALYKYAISEADEKGFLAQARAVKDFDGDGDFNLWEIDQDGNLRQVIKD